MFKRVYLEITNVCNLRCSFCPGTRRASRFMTPSEFTLLAQKLRPYTDYLYFHVLGEPLLHPQLSEMLATAHTLGFRVCLTTNGTLLSDRLSTLLCAPALHKISVSLHSFEANENANTLSDYLAGVWNSCEALSKNGVLCALRLWNAGGLDAENENILQFLSQKIHCRVEDLPADRRGNRTLLPRIFLEHAEKFDWPDPQAPEANVQFCHGLRQQIAVLCDGTVVPCCLDGEGNIPLGNLFHDEMADILSSPRAKAMADGFARRQPTEELCRRCGYAARFSR